MMKSIRRWIDAIFFIRNPYVIVKHVVPFLFASLVLLTLSVPTDNLLLKLAALLKDPGSIYIPAILLTLGASVIYFLTIRSLSTRMYLWPKHDLRRAFFTCIISIAVCIAMSYGVLQSTGCIINIYADLWACYLVSILSLTGVGWSGLGDWVEAMGIKYPNYESGRQEAQKISDLLKSVRKQKKGSEEDVNNFLKATNNLLNNIERNMEKEPEWAREELKDAYNCLKALTENVQKYFPPTNKSAVADFAVVCNYQKDFQYQDVVRNLKDLNKFLHDWVHK